MAIVRKLYESKQKEKKKKVSLGQRPIKVKSSLDIDSLPNAIVSGSMNFSEGDRLIYRKDFLRDVTVSYVTAAHVNIEENSVDLWDETRQQWTYIDVKDADKYTLKKEVIHPFKDRKI